jgi:hypothetical protein
MKVKVKNIAVSDLDLKDLKMKRLEVKIIDFTEKVRYYVAKGYIKLVDMYPSKD